MHIQRTPKEKAIGGPIVTTPDFRPDLHKVHCIIEGYQKNCANQKWKILTSLVTRTCRVANSFGVRSSTKLCGQNSFYLLIELYLNG
jgi:hypothetical protein